MTILVTIHCDSSYLEDIKEKNLNWEYSPKFGIDEIDVIVEDKDLPDYDEYGVYVDPDEAICDHYDINYDFVNCIEARNFVA